MEDYKYGFESEIDQDILPIGLDENVVRYISNSKNEPSWLLDFRLKAFAKWQTMTQPNWAELDLEPIAYQKISYLATSKPIVTEEIKELWNKLGISQYEQDILSDKKPISKPLAMDFVLDSTSVHTSFTQELEKIGVLFCSLGEAVQKYPELVKKYLGSVVPFTDNFFACLNSAVFSDGSFCYIPKGVDCPMELSTYFRINSSGTGQFERTLIICEGQVSYLEGCTAPARDENQLHSAVVELVALENAKIKYSTIQNWYSGDKNGVGGVYNLVTKRGLCKGKNSHISWTQVETGSAITWKYPSVILRGDGSSGDFYSVAFTKNHQQADTGTKMIHIGKNTKSKIVSKSLVSGSSKNTYRGLVQIAKNASNSQNFTQCDTLFTDNKNHKLWLSILNKLPNTNP